MLLAWRAENLNEQQNSGRHSRVDLYLFKKNTEFQIRIEKTRVMVN